MNCSVCGQPLTGGVDTFGDVGAEVCFADYFLIQGDAPEQWRDEYPDDPDYDDESIRSLEAEIEYHEEALQRERRCLDRALELRDKPLADAKKALDKWRRIAS